MDFAKIGRSTWNSLLSTTEKENSDPLVPGAVVTQFQSSAEDARFSSNKLQEVLGLLREGSSRQLVDRPASAAASEHPHQKPKLSASRSAKGLRPRVLEAKLLNVQEQPASRQQISDLQRSLLSKVKKALTQLLANPSPN